MYVKFEINLLEGAMAQLPSLSNVGVIVVKNNVKRCRVYDILYKGKLFNLRVYCT